jgi:hypothetical protein
VCRFCSTAEGACTECSEPSCSQAFHVPCALQAGIRFEYKEVPGDSADLVVRLAASSAEAGAPA